MAAGRKIKYITLASLFAISLSIGIGYASWQFNDSQSSSLNNNVGINSWRFSQALPIEPGQTIDIASDGTVTIDGEVIEDADIEYPGGTPNTNGGTVNMKIGVDDDGNLVVTEYSAEKIGSDHTWYGGSNSTVTLPASIDINGVTYSILGLSEPISLDSSAPGLFGATTITFNVPNGYEYLCDNAFQDISGSSGLLSSANISFSIPSTLTYLGNSAFNYDSGSTGLSISSVTYAGTRAQWRELIANSAAAYGSGYKFFSGITSTTGRATITCSDGTISYDRNGVEV